MTTTDMHYSLFISAGKQGIYWRLKNNGVSVRNDRLAWTIDGVRHEGSFSDIREVRLLHTWAGKSGSLGVCSIIFRDGYILTIYGGSDHGLGDDTQAAIYADFLHDFHRRLPAQEKQRIQFNAGFGGGRRTVVTIATFAAILMFGVLPIGLFLYIREWEVFFVMAGALAFLWPLWKSYAANEPRTYPPDQIPEDLT